MSTTVAFHEYDRMAELGLADYGDFADRVTFVNQSEFGDGQLEGEWFYIPEEADDPGWVEKCRVIYSGSFGNDNSPGASHYSAAEVYHVEEPEGEGEDELQQFGEAKKEWEAKPEYNEEDSPEEDEDEDEWEYNEEDSPDDDEDEDRIFGEDEREYGYEGDM